jgi:hypothetical protein
MQCAWRLVSAISIRVGPFFKGLKKDFAKVVEVALVAPAIIHFLCALVCLIRARQAGHRVVGFSEEVCNPRYNAVKNECEALVCYSFLCF